MSKMNQMIGLGWRTFSSKFPIRSLMAIALKMQTLRRICADSNLVYNLLRRLSMRSVAYFRLECAKTNKSYSFFPHLESLWIHDSEKCFRGDFHSKRDEK